MSVKVRMQGAVMHVVLARPDKRNAFDGDMLTAIEAAIDRANSDAGCRVVVLSGEGKAFCAGADLRWLAGQAAGGPEGNVASARRMGGVFHHVSTCKRPTIARVQGPAMGGGVGLASACDLVVAAESAFFTLSEVRLGLVPAVISPFVIRRIGPARGRSVFMLGEHIPARAAERMGLADVVVQGESPEALAAALDRAVEGLCASLLRGGPEAQWRCKQLADAVAGRDPADVLDMTAALIADVRAGDEARAGIAAFLSKQPAPWIPRAPDDPASDQEVPA